MKKILLVGDVACGKTTLCQRINGEALNYKKTQVLEVINTTIDTPGEYLEHRSLTCSLVVTSVEVDNVVFVQDASQERYMFSPGQATAFPKQVIGVVTKIDIATEKQRDLAHELLYLAGANPIFEISAISGEGLEAFLAYITCD